MIESCEEKQILKGTKEEQIQSRCQISRWFGPPDRHSTNIKAIFGFLHLNPPNLEA